MNLFVFNYGWVQNIVGLGTWFSMLKKLLTISMMEIKSTPIGWLTLLGDDWNCFEHCPKKLIVKFLVAQPGDQRQWNSINDQLFFQSLDQWPLSIEKFKNLGNS